MTMRDVLIVLLFLVIISAIYLHDRMEIENLTEAICEQRIEIGGEGAEVSGVLVLCPDPGKYRPYQAVTFRADYSRMDLSLKSVGGGK